MSSNDLVVDLTNFRERVSSHIPEGVYNVTVEDAEKTISNKVNEKTGQKSQGVILYLRVNDPSGEADGATLIDRLWLIDSSLFRVVNFLQAIGYPTPRKRLNLDISKWVGKHLSVQVEDGEPYKGRVKSEVREFRRSEAPSESGGEPDLADLSETPALVAEDPAPVTEKDTVSVPSEPEEIDLAEIDI